MVQVHSPAPVSPRKPFDFRPYTSPSAEVKALETQLLALNAIIKKTPGFTEPIGFAIGTAGDMMQTTFRQSIGTRQPAITTLPIPAILSFGAFGVYEFNRGGTSCATMPVRRRD